MSRTECKGWQWFGRLDKRVAMVFKCHELSETCLKSTNYILRYIEMSRSVCEAWQWFRRSDKRVWMMSKTCRVMFKGHELSSSIHENVAKCVHGIIGKLKECKRHEPCRHISKVHEPLSQSHEMSPTVWKGSTRYTDLDFCFFVQISLRPLQIRCWNFKIREQLVYRLLPYDLVNPAIKNSLL